MFAVTEDFYKVLLYCQRWGVEVKFDFPDYDDMSGLFTSRVDLSHVMYTPILRHIYWHDKKNECWSHWLLHELSHCLASKNPSCIDEPGSEMIAFEYYSTRYLKISGWTEFMADYSLGDGRPWYYHSQEEKSIVLKRSLVKAMNAGLLDVNGKPTFRRRHVKGMVQRHQVQHQV